MADYALRSLGQSFSSGHVLAPHAHPWGQLIYAISGTMQVAAGNTLWLVPPTRALWAPAGVTHAIEMRGAVAMRTIYVPAARAEALPRTVHAIDIAPLLREMIVHIVGLRMLRAEEASHRHLAAVFLDLVAAAPSLPLFVPMPEDSRAAAVARLLRDDPAREDGIEALARQVGASVRTLQRVFREETGLRFVEWRQRLRLLHAIALLEQGASVTEAGAAAGYASTSAFIAAFRQQMGDTPSRYARQRA
ncbi:MAG: helix-turn-helix transcriptional regulator [Rhizomicrobium sp.]